MQNRLWQRDHRDLRAIQPDAGFYNDVSIDKNMLSVNTSLHTHQPITWAQYHWTIITDTPSPPPNVLSTPSLCLPHSLSRLWECSTIRWMLSPQSLSGHPPTKSSVQSLWSGWALLSFPVHQRAVCAFCLDPGIGLNNSGLLTECFVSFLCPLVITETLRPSSGTTLLWSVLSNRCLLCVLSWSSGLPRADVWLPGPPVESSHCGTASPLTSRPFCR